MAFNYPLVAAREFLPAFFPGASGAELTEILAILEMVDLAFASVVAETQLRAPSSVVRGVTLHDVAPRCLTAQARLGDLSLHVSLLSPRYFRGAKDDLWRAQADAYVVCGHPDHDIDPVMEIPERTASSPREAASAYLQIMHDLSEAVPSWELRGEAWHAKLWP